MKSHSRLRRYLFALPLLGVMPLCHAAADASLVAAIDNLWDAKAISINVRGGAFDGKPAGNATLYRSTIAKAPGYLLVGAEGASIAMGQKRFDAGATPWGNFPRLDMPHARLLEVSLPKKHYWVIAGPGSGLFSVGDWQRYGFLHVLDVSAPAAPVHYPLYADGELGEHVIGRLPDSPVLNYARLVPSSRNANGQIDGYEVTLYALERRGPQRVIKDGAPLAYSLKLANTVWTLSDSHGTPLSDQRDAKKRPFTALPPAALFKGIVTVKEDHPVE